MKYRLIKTIGPYWNTRWTVQEQYRYYENGKWITAWSDYFHSGDLQMCREALKRLVQRRETRDGQL